MSDNTPLEFAVPEAPFPPDKLLEAAEQQFRTVTTLHGRAGIRIERVFWEGLASISEMLGIKRSELVGTIVDRAAAGSVYLASALRSYVAMVQQSEIDRLRGLLDTTQLAKLQQMAPVPSFALTRKKRLVSANAEFVQYLRSLSGDPANTISPDVAQLSLDRPIEQLFDELKTEGAFVRCTLTIRVDDRQRRALCKIVAVPPSPAQAIVGYVLDQIGN